MSRSVMPTLTPLTCLEYNWKFFGSPSTSTKLTTNIKSLNTSHVSSINNNINTNTQLKYRKRPQLPKSMNVSPRLSPRREDDGFEPMTMLRAKCRDSSIGDLNEQTIKDICFDYYHILPQIKEKNTPKKLTPLSHSVSNTYFIGRSTQNPSILESEGKPVKTSSSTSTHKHTRSAIDKLACIIDSKKATVEKIQRELADTTVRLVKGLPAESNTKAKRTSFHQQFVASKDRVHSPHRFDLVKINCAPVGLIEPSNDEDDNNNKNERARNTSTPKEDVPHEMPMIDLTSMRVSALDHRALQIATPKEFSHKIAELRRSLEEKKAKNAHQNGRIPELEYQEAALLRPIIWDDRYKDKRFYQVLENSSLKRQGMMNKVMKHFNNRLSAQKIKGSIANWLGNPGTSGTHGTMQTGDEQFS